MKQEKRVSRVGWIGVGAMGRPMCLNLLKAGYVVTAFDRNPEQLERIRGEGVGVAASPGELARDCEVVFSTIFDDQGLRDIVLAPNGLAAGVDAASVYVDMSTVSPAASAEVAQALATRGVAYLRAPVSGTVSLAESAQLSTFVSGPREAFDLVRPLLVCLTARQSHLGTGEEARVVKLVINLLVSMSTATLGEALAFGQKAGLDRGLLIDAINDSIAGSPHYRVKADKIKHRDYSPAGSVALVIKDMSMALKVADATGSALPIAQSVHQTLLEMDRRGFGHCDIAALVDSADLLTAGAGGSSR